jgi:CBS domain-containing protein
VEQLVKDIMQSHVVRVGTDDPLISICQLFNDERISGAPVVSETGRVVGVVSLMDIVRAAGDDLPHTIGENSYYQQMRAAQPSWMEDPDEISTRLSSLRASDVMTEELVHIHPSAPMSELAKLVRERHVHRVLVVEPQPEGEKLVGIVSLFDIVALLEENK